MMHPGRDSQAAGLALRAQPWPLSRLQGILPAGPCDRWILFCTSACVFLTVFSIAGSQIFLALAVAGLLYHRGFVADATYEPPPAWLPTLAFMLTTGFAVLLSPEFSISLRAMKKFFLFFILFFTYNWFRTFAQIDRLYRFLFFAAVLTSLYGMMQYPMSSEGHRITGFMGHWMTYSGVQLLLFCALLVFALYFYKPVRWSVPVLLLVAGSILLSLTRSVWIGAFFASATAVALKRSRGLMVIPLVLLAILAVSPHTIINRAKTLLTLEDRAISVRFNMMTTGVRMIQAHPLVGVGPNRVSRVAYDYGADKTVAPWYYVHLHNNILQIGAERGLPCLLAWLWLMFTFFRDYWRMARRLSFRDKRSYPLAIAISALVGILIAGLFEYNFGDSEPVMLLFFVLAAPYVVDRELRSQPSVS